MTPFFFVGNVRSGTSLMVRELNRHPNVYVSHESDVCWILYQFFTHGRIVQKSFGGQKALNYTMKHCKKYIDVERSVRANYEKIQTKLMRKGSLWLYPMKKKDVKYIGDKTPNNFVVCDEYVDFVERNFPDAVYLHMVRHPKDFVASVRNRIKAHYHFGKKDKDILDWWVMAEKKVIELKNRLPITSIRYSDLGECTGATINKVFQGWGLPRVEGVKNQFVKRHDYDVELTKDACELIERYGL